MTEPMFYDRTGKPIELMEWARHVEDLPYKRVAATPLTSAGIEHGPWVSTVWLGMDHGWGRTAAPIIFETMVFGVPGLEDDQWRYASEEDALAGHAHAVALAKTALDVAEPGGADEPGREDPQDDTVVTHVRPETTDL